MEARPRLRHDKSKINLRLEIPAAATKSVQPELLGGPFKTYLKNKTLSLTPEEDCPLCRQKIRPRKMPAMINRALAIKYSNSINYYFTKDINDILAGNRCRATIDMIESKIDSGDRDCVVSCVDIGDFKEKFTNLWKYHQFNIDQPKQDYRGILEVVEGYFHGKRKIQEKAIKKMLDVMTDSELEACEIHLSRFASQPQEIVEVPYEDSDRLIPKGICGERKASSISLSIIEAIGMNSKTGKFSKSQAASGRPYSKNMFTQPRDSIQISGFSQFFESDKADYQGKRQSVDWPSFVDSEEKAQLDNLASHRSTCNKKPDTLLRLDRYFSKKVYQEKISVVTDTRVSKSKQCTSRREGSLSGSASGRPLALTMKTRKIREVSKNEPATSNEKKFKRKTIEKSRSPEDQRKSKPTATSVSKLNKLKLKEKKMTTLTSTKKLMNQVATKIVNKAPPKIDAENKDRFPIAKLVKNLRCEIADKTSIGIGGKSKVQSQRAGSRSKSTKKTLLTNTFNKDTQMNSSNCFKSKSSEKKILGILQKKQKIVKPISSTTNYLAHSIQKSRNRGNLESASAKSIGIHSRHFETDSKRLKSRPRFAQQTSNAKTLPEVAGYDPFMQNSYHAVGSPRDPLQTAVKKSKADSSQINVYSSGFMHKIILSKRNQMSDTKLGQGVLTSGLPSEERLNQYSRSKFRQGSNSLHQMCPGPSFDTRQRSGSPPNSSPKNATRPIFN